jgi:hypothetical protein
MLDKAFVVVRVVGWRTGRSWFEVDGSIREGVVEWEKIEDEWSGYCNILRMKMDMFVGRCEVQVRTEAEVEKYFVEVGYFHLGVPVPRSIAFDCARLANFRITT